MKRNDDYLDKYARELADAAVKSLDAFLDTATDEDRKVLLDCIKVVQSIAEKHHKKQAVAA